MAEAAVGVDEGEYIPDMSYRLYNEDGELLDIGPPPPPPPFE